MYASTKPTIEASTVAVSSATPPGDRSSTVMPFSLGPPGPGSHPCHALVAGRPGCLPGATGGPRARDSWCRVFLYEPRSAEMDMKLEVVVVPVSDVDRAKEFYTRLGWRLDADFASDDGFRVVQVTPPGSPASVI